MTHLGDDLCFDTTHSFLLLRNDLIRKKHLTINTMKLNFVKKTSSMLYPNKMHLKYQEL